MYLDNFLLFYFSYSLLLDNSDKFVYASDSPASLIKGRNFITLDMRQNWCCIPFVSSSQPIQTVAPISVIAINLYLHHYPNKRPLDLQIPRPDINLYKCKKCRSRSSVTALHGLPGLNSLKKATHTCSLIFPNLSSQN